MSTLVHEDDSGGKRLYMASFALSRKGIPDYRFICQEMWRKIQEVHPALAEAGKFID